VSIKVSGDVIGGPVFPARQARTSPRCAPASTRSPINSGDRPRSAGIDAASARSGGDAMHGRASVRAVDGLHRFFDGSPEPANFGRGGGIGVVFLGTLAFR
jgi:hypothetical protein